jgi:hypothetical protein
MYPMFIRFKDNRAVVLRCLLLHMSSPVCSAPCRTPTGHWTCPSSAQASSSKYTFLFDHTTSPAALPTAVYLVLPHWVVHAAPPVTPQLATGPGCFQHKGLRCNFFTVTQCSLLHCLLLSVAAPPVTPRLAARPGCYQRRLQLHYPYCATSFPASACCCPLPRTAVHAAPPVTPRLATGPGRHQRRLQGVHGEGLHGELQAAAVRHVQPAVLPVAAPAEG